MSSQARRKPRTLDGCQWTTEAEEIAGLALGCRRADGCGRGLGYRTGTEVLLLLLVNLFIVLSV